MRIGAVPYDRTRIRPGIVHLGLGGFHRAHMARYAHDLMAADEAGLDWGIIGVGLREADRSLLDTLRAQDGLYTLIERDAAGETATCIGSIVRTIDASASTAELLDAIDDPAIRIVSLTVTEHGYCLDRATKRLDPGHPLIVHDLANLHAPKSAIGVLVEAFARRRAGGLSAFTALSCDNIQHNGDVLRCAALAFAELRDPALAAWIEEYTAFPNAMVDRITPVPTPVMVRDIQSRLGIDDDAPLMAEPFRQWVIEDRFASGHPGWDRVGAQFVADVTPYEKMKLRLLNASHLAVAGLGALAGHVSIADAIGDPLIRRHMQALMDRETGPTLDPVPGIDLAAYKRALVDRFANPAIPDTVQRVNTDAALNYLLDPIRDRLAANEPLPLLALALAAWLRRVRGEDEAGRPIAVHHPLADAMREAAMRGGSDPAPLLSMRALFGDLGDDPRLREAVSPWLASLYADGVSATLEHAARQGLI
ncbi:mannitol dehydrogenase [Nostoc sp. 3335mG]|nr:mannitol dehydrogenase [Nostoc sp. 3335mG]